MVRSYVAQVGVAQARAMAQANGMTSSDEQRARRCLAHRWCADLRTPRPLSRDA